MAEHDELPGDQVHIPYRQVFADAAARTGDATVYVAGDVNKKALQLDTGAEFRLSNHSPTTWTAVGDGAGGDMETTYDLGGAITTLDVDGGNTLTWDSATPDPVGLGLFRIVRDQGGGEVSILKAPQQVDDSENPGTSLFLISGGGSNQVTGGTGNAGTDAGGMIIGGSAGVQPGGVGSAASGAGQAGAAGGGGGSFAVDLPDGGAGGDGSSADPAGAGGSSAEFSLVASMGGAGGAAGTTGAAGVGGEGQLFRMEGSSGGPGGDGTAAGVAGDGGDCLAALIQGGNGGNAGADGGGGGADGGNGATLTVKGGDAGTASGGETDGNAGGLIVDAGVLSGGGNRAPLDLGAANASQVNIGRAVALVPFVGIPTLPTFTVATVPNASIFARGLIFVSDETGGAVPAYSDGTNWRRFSDGVIVS